MKNFVASLERYALSAFAMVSMLAGCGGSQFRAGDLSAMPQIRGIATAAAHGGSWMLPQATSQDLLYVANVNGTVTVYSYPQGKMVGTLLGFDRPLGECVDSSGNVFITVYVLQNVREYAHGSAKPIAILKNLGLSPTSCSVDPVTGNLAVAVEGSGGYGIAIYPKAKGVPKIWSAGIESQFCGYDNKGNLFASGFNPSGPPALAELPKGAHKFQNIEFNANAVGAVQWDGKYLAIGNGYDGDGMHIYRFSVAGGKATQKGAATLIGSTTTVFWIQGATVAARNDYANVGLWGYPRGGYPTKIVYQGVDGPTGLTISLATTR